ncbi:MAG: hypothetical protein Q8889_02685, partial [Candidatus Phytoplasma australasiaticum]|nr:hypothetical protein [Candidatus Phytoplasma australasiaticum]
MPVENQPLEIHHIGIIRDANWRSMMNKRTIVLCQGCYRKRTNQQMRDIRIFEKNKRSRISNHLTSGDTKLNPERDKLWKA